MGLLDCFGLQRLPELGVDGLHAGDVVLELVHMRIGEAGLFLEIPFQVGQLARKVQVYLGGHVIPQVSGALFDQFRQLTQPLLDGSFLFAPGLIQGTPQMIKLLIEQ